MPGFTGDPANWQQFWISFWSSLSSGAIYSLFVGLIVGFFLLLAQKRSDKRQQRLSCESQLATFREHLRALLDQADIVHLDRIGSLPPRLVKIVDLLTNSPIDLWRDNLPKHQEFIGLLRTFQRNYANLNSVASELEVNVRQIIREYTHSQQISDPSEREYQSFISGRILGYDDAKLLVWIGLERRMLPRMYEVYDLVLADEEANALVKKYLDAQKQVEDVVEMLKKALN
jgi:hypothetical protein